MMIVMPLGWRGSCGRGGGGGVIVVSEVGFGL